MEPEFIIDEKPSGPAVDLRDAVGVAIRREYELRKSQSQDNLSAQEELRRVADFLRSLVTAKENRCDELIKVERARTSEASSQESAVLAERNKWLKRLEMIQSAFDSVLESYGVTRFVPSGSAIPDRDDIKDTVSGTGMSAGTIVEVIKPGYLWRGEVLRPAQVSVAE